MTKTLEVRKSQEPGSVHSKPVLPSALAAGSSTVVQMRVREGRRKETRGLGNSCRLRASWKHALPLFSDSFSNFFLQEAVLGIEHRDCGMNHSLSPLSFFPFKVLTDHHQVMRLAQCMILLLQPRGVWVTGSRHFNNCEIRVHVSLGLLIFTTDDRTGLSGE